LVEASVIRFVISAYEAVMQSVENAVLALSSVIRSIPLA
jgi:hypothetical protein